MTAADDVIHTRIWEEEAEPDNPFAARTCLCSGYDVYGDLLGKVSWIEYLYLLFRLEPPEQWQTTVLEGLAVAVANPGPRDASVRAAMCGGVGGSTYASSLMAALAPGAGRLGGAQEVRLAMDLWRRCGSDFEAWRQSVENNIEAHDNDIWPATEHVPGFDPNGNSCARPVLQTLEYLAAAAPKGPLSWLSTNRSNLERVVGFPLSMPGVAACALAHLGFESTQGEMLFLLLRLPGAAAHALEQERYGWRRYPFFSTRFQLAPEADPGVSHHS